MESLQPLITHRFWVLFGLAMLLIPLGWWLGVGDLKTKIEAGESAIKQAQSGIPSGKNPNPDWIKGGKEVNQLRNSYYDKHAQELYRKQRELQTWPEGIASRFANIPYLGNVPPRICSVYRDAYFRDSIPMLYRIVDPVVVLDKTKNTFKGKVVFELDDLPKVEYAKWDNVPPESKELWEAQEDVWLLTALLKAIARVNAGEDRIDRVAIRRILEISLHGGTAEGAEGAAGGGDKGAAGMSPSGAGIGGEGTVGGASGRSIGLGGMGEGEGSGGAGSDGYSSIKLNPEDWFGKPRPRKTEGAGGESPKPGMMGMGVAGESGPGGGSSNKDSSKFSPYVDENPDEPFKTRGFILTVLMKRREIIRLQEQLGLMSFPVEIKVVQHVDRDPDLRGISIFRETNNEIAGGAAAGGEGGESGPMGEGGAGTRRIPGSGTVITGGLGSRPGGGARAAGGNGGGRGKYPPAVTSALEDHGLCYVSIAGLMTIYQPPKSKAAANIPAAKAAPKKPEPKKADAGKQDPSQAKSAKPDAGTNPATKTPAKKPTLKTPAVKTPAGKAPAGKTPASKLPANGQPAGKPQPGGKQPATKKTGMAG